MSKLFNVVTDYCARNRDEIFKSYMAKRNWTEETVQKFKLGYFPTNDLLSLKVLATRHAIHEEDLIAQGIHRKSKSIFSNRIIFPVQNVWGDIIAITGRSLDEAVKPKYYNTVFEKGKNLFGLNFSIDAALKTKRIHVFEGNADVITAHQYGIENAVCVMGTTLSPEHLILLSRYVKEIVLMFDNDEGGLKALKSFNKKKLDLEFKETSILRCKLVGAKDADEYLNKFGKDALMEHIDKSISDEPQQNRLKSIS